jgi:hypothetical protein
MVSGDAAPLVDTVRAWRSAAAVTRQLDALDDYLTHHSCFLGRTSKELLYVFADGEQNY